MNLQEKRRQAYRAIARTAVAKVGRLRRVVRGAKDYQTGTFAEERWTFEVLLIEQKQRGASSLAEVQAGSRRFLLALSGRAFLCDGAWNESGAASQLPRPLSDDRLWIESEGQELFLDTAPSLLDAGLGVLFEAVVS